MTAPAKKSALAGSRNTTIVVLLLCALAVAALDLYVFRDRSDQDAGLRSPMSLSTLQAVPDARLIDEVGNDMAVRAYPNPRVQPRDAWRRLTPEQQTAFVLTTNGPLLSGAGFSNWMNDRQTPDVNWRDLAEAYHNVGCERVAKAVQRAADGMPAMAPRGDAMDESPQVRSADADDIVRKALREDNAEDKVRAWIREHAADLTR